MGKLILLRGTSGSGKSSIAQHIKDISKGGCSIRTADDYFIDIDGEYKFDASKLGNAHARCLENVTNDMFFKVETVICANTNTTEKELAPYIEVAAKYGYDVVSLIVEHRHEGKNTHGVPEETLQKQEQRLRSSLKL